MSNLTPEQIIEKARFNALTPSQKGLETKAKKAKAAKAVSAPQTFVNLLDAEIKAPKVKAVKVNDGFLNPFTEGVTYAEFLSSIPNGKTVAEHLQGKLTNTEINWICEEVEHFKTLKE
jgi:hypothetical protein